MFYNVQDDTLSLIVDRQKGVDNTSLHVGYIAFFSLT